MATSDIYRSIGTYVVYKTETVWGTAGTPVGTDYVDRVINFNSTIENNPIITHGIGEGANFNKSLNGPVDITGEMTWLLTDADFLKYGFVGTLKAGGAGSTAAPYVIQEQSSLGYGVGQTNSFTLEVGKEAATADVMTYDGCHFTSLGITGTQGDASPITCSGSFVARDVVSSSTALTYTGPTGRAFTWVDSSVAVSGNTVGECASFSLTVNNEFTKRRELGSRRLLQPTLIKRRYSLVLTMRMRKDATSGILDGLDARGLVFDGSTAAVGTSASFNGSNAGQEIIITLVENTGASGDREIKFQFQNAYFQNIAEPIDLGNGDVELTLNISPQAGIATEVVSWRTIT